MSILFTPKNDNDRPLPFFPGNSGLREIAKGDTRAAFNTLFSICRVVGGLDFESAGTMAYSIIVALKDPSASWYIFSEDVYSMYDAPEASTRVNILRAAHIAQRRGWIGEGEIEDVIADNLDWFDGLEISLSAPRRALQYYTEAPRS